MKKFLLIAALLCLSLPVEAQTIGPAPSSGGGGTPCTVTATSLQYNNAGAFGCVTDWTSNGTNLTAALGTITSNINALTITGTWNNAGVVFDAPLFMNITATAAANSNTIGSDSLLMDLQVAGGTYFSVGRGNNQGMIVLGNSSVGAASILNVAGTLQLTPRSGFLLQIGGGNVAVNIGTTISAGGSFVTANHYSWFGFSPGDGAQNNTADTAWFRDAAIGAMALADPNSGTTATGMRVYNMTDNVASNVAPTNYERGVADFLTSANVFTVGAQKGGTGTLRNTALVGALITIPGITTDSTHTDASVCQDTTSHALYFGSGAAGICLGTSSLRFKHDVASLDVGLKQIMALQPIKYKLNADRGNPDKVLYGFSAEQGRSALPKLVGNDERGTPSTFDYMGVVPVLVKAIQEQQAEIERLKRRVAR